AWRRVAATLSVVLVSVVASAPWSRAQAATATVAATAASGALQFSTSFIDPFAGAGDIHQANQAMVFDSQGNTIVAGSFSGQINFGGGVLISQAAPPNKNIFLVKYSASGGFLWSKAIGGTNSVNARAVAVDSGGNIYITGLMKNTTDFGGGPLTGPSGQNGYLAKYSSQGNYLWARLLGNYFTGGTSLRIDSAGNVVVGGSFYTSTDFGGGPINSVTAGDMFLAKYSSTGSYVAAWRVGGSGSFQNVKL